MFKVIKQHGLENSTKEKKAIKKIKKINTTTKKMA